MSIRRFTVLSSAALAALAFATSAAAQDADGRRELVRDALERDASPVGGVNGLEDGLVDPTPWAGLPDDSRRPGAPTNPLPGIAWTPGGPGSGGGTGGPGAPDAVYGDVWEELAELEPFCPLEYESCGFDLLNDSATLVGGSVSLPRLDMPDRGCTADVTHAALFELDDQAQVVAVHELPNVIPTGGRDRATLADVNDSGVAVGDSFAYWTCPDSCTCDEERPVAWQPQSDGTYRQVDLPMPHGALYGSAHSINEAGWIVGRTVDDLDGDGLTDGSRGVVWLPDAGQPSGYRLEELSPLGPGYFTEVNIWSYQLSDTGLAVGYYWLDAAEAPLPVVWERDALGSWSPTILEGLGSGWTEGLTLTADGSILGISRAEVVDEQTGEVIEQRRWARWTREPASGTWMAPEQLGLDGAHDQSRIFQDTPGFVVGQAATSLNGAEGGWSIWILSNGTWEFLGAKLGQQWDPFLEDMGGYRWLLVRDRPGGRLTRHFIVAPQRL